MIHCHNSYRLDRVFAVRLCQTCASNPTLFCFYPVGKESIMKMYIILFTDIHSTYQELVEFSNKLSFHKKPIV